MPLASEKDLLAIIDGFFPRSASGIILGRGDDCAEFESAAPLALSTDLFIENIHFKRQYFTPEEIGRKALAVNLSDLAAAGAVPFGFTASVFMPKSEDSAWIKGVLRGMSELANESNIILVGGDVSSSSNTGFSITVWGKAQPLSADFWQGKRLVAKASEIKAASLGKMYGVSECSFTDSGFIAEKDCKNIVNCSFLRRQAKKGDVVFALGPGGVPGAGLGLARLGLKLLEERGRKAARDYPASCKALLNPRPMLDCGQLLAWLNTVLSEMVEVSASSLEQDAKNNFAPISAMDLSDGLFSDLPRLCGSLSNSLVTEQIPGFELTLGPEGLHPELLQFYTINQGLRVGKKFALATALGGGDEYVLLCACTPAILPLLERTLQNLAEPPSLQVVGYFSDSTGIRINGKLVSEYFEVSGFDHFT